MKNHNRFRKTISRDRLTLAIAVAVVAVLAMICSGGLGLAAPPGAKPAGKAPAEAVAGVKAPPKALEKPVEQAPLKTDAGPIVSPQADSLLREMGEYLKNPQQFSFRAEITFDDVLPSGQKIQFGASEDLAVRRPDKVYVDYRGDLGLKRFWLGTGTVTLYDPQWNFYASEKVPAELDEAMNQLMKDFGFSPPLADLLNPDPYKALIGRVQFGLYIGQSMIEGQRCHHLAFVEKYIDWQVWIEDGKQLVPRKLLITYKTIPGSPQFTAVLSDWDFTTVLPDTLFAASVPPGAEKIEFAKVGRILEKN